MIRIKEIRGKDILVKRIDQLVREVQGEAMADVLTRGLEPIAADARSRAPVRTGYLRDHIRTTVVKVGGGRAEAALIAEAPYAPYVEYGTRYMAARPFLRPAIAAAQHTAVVTITGELATRIFKAIR